MALRTIAALRPVLSGRALFAAARAAPQALAALQQHEASGSKPILSFAVLAGGALALGANVALCEEQEQQQQQKKGFRDSKIAAYEDRIRFFSTPDKVFRYFATVQIDKTVYMRPSDFVRAVTPGTMQPREYGLDVYEQLPSSYGIVKNAKVSARLFSHKLNGDILADEDGGLISYGEFLFLLTTISASPREFELAFRMFDLDGNGIVDLEEFAKVQLAVQRQTPAGRRLHGTDASTVSKDELARSRLLQKFFGADGKGKLTFEAFKAFMHEVQDDVVHLDFLAHVPGEDKSSIDEVSFTQMLLMHARMKESKKPEYYDRVKKYYKTKGSKGFTLQQVRNFFTFLRAIDDLSMALGIYAAADVPITKSDLIRAAKTVAGVDLGEAMIDFLFVLFDRDGDGRLAHSEFINIMKDARSRGLNHEKDLGVERGLKSLLWCVKQRMRSQEEGDL